MNKILYFLKNDPKRLLIILLAKIAPIFPDKLYLKLFYRLEMGCKLNLENPQTFNEKLQWLKLYNRKPEYTQMVDKVEAKKYVENLIGEEYIIPTLGVYNSVDEIDFDKLPNQFVLKCTHDSGYIVICKEKKLLDINAIKRKLKKGLKRKYYYYSREWPYKNVKPRIIAEHYIADSNGEANDFKFFCFNGEPKVMLMATERRTGVKFDYFDMDFNHLPFEQGGPNSEKELSKPTSMDKMVELARILSKDIPHVRIDLYNIDGKIYFGEMTFFDSSGMAQFNPKEWDYTFGSWINLPNKNIL